eukprot:s7114_g3.t1
MYALKFHDHSSQSEGWPEKWAGTGESAQLETVAEPAPEVAFMQPPTDQRAIPKRRARPINQRCDGIFESNPTTRPAVPYPTATDESCTKVGQVTSADARAEPHVRWAPRPLLARECGN